MARWPVAVLACLCSTLPIVPAGAEEAPGGVGTASTGSEVGTALFVLLAVVIGVSVVSKLLIYFHIVPRQPENGLHSLVHGAANVVGGLTRQRPRRRPGDPSP